MQVVLHTDEGEVVCFPYGEEEAPEVRGSRVNPCFRYGAATTSPTSMDGAGYHLLLPHLPLPLPPLQGVRGEGGGQHL